ncbi:MAG: alpha/beta hydrolase [Pseudomonadota bacterium]
MELIFVHGWGFGPDTWNGVLEHMSVDGSINSSMVCVDLGFFQDSASNLATRKNTKCVDELSILNDWPSNAVVVGHSLGVLWLLKYAPSTIAGFVSVCGFDRFVPHIHKNTLLTMEQRLIRNPKRQLQQFWTACGLSNKETYSTLAECWRLQNGLRWLQNWDQTKQKNELPCPLMVLAGFNDNIVSQNMSAIIWENAPHFYNNILWHETAGHALPFHDPKWIANHLNRFINDLEYRKSQETHCS